jgi:hypothetical protein
MECSPVCEKDVAEELRTTLNWKAPEGDQIVNFCFLLLTETHKHIAALFNKLIEEDKILEWLTAGVIFLIPKNVKTDHTKNYKPVTCLPTIYKLLTPNMSRRMQKYMEDKSLTRKEQKGFCRGSKGCKDQLLISKAILQACKRRKENLYSIWYGLIIPKLLTGCHTIG